ncbi:MAG: ABC transporter permease [Desulfurococcales archaeon]|nr:ABC transporter permease [Desulfurococcales archaeon]
MARSILNYLFMRLLQVIPTVLGVLFIVFFLSRILPGNPVIAILGPKATPENIEKVVKELGLDKDYFTQFIEYLGDVIRLDFGRSYIMNVEVRDLLFDRLPASFELVIVAYILSIIIGLPLGIIAALKRGTWVDDLVRILGVIGISMPTIWLGMVLQIVFGIYLGFPVGERIDPLLAPKKVTGFMLIDTLLEGNIYGFLDALKRIALPALTLALPLSGLLMRLVRTSMVEVLLSDYIRTAKMKRVPRDVLLYRHALKNALIPVVTVMGLYFAVVVTGDIIVETIFSWPGIGRLIYEAVLLRDYMVIQGAVIFISLIYVLVNLVVDVLYFYIDPRIKA